MNGKDVLILVNTSGSTYVAVGSQTGATVTETNEIIDQSSKDARERAVAAGRYEANVSFNALYVPSDTAFAALKTAMRNGTEIILRQQVSGVSVEQYSAIITNMTREFPDQDNATIQLEAAVNGAITAISI